MPKCDFNKVAKQLYCNHTSAWVFFSKLNAYLQNTFRGILLESCFRKLYFSPLVELKWSALTNNYYLLSIDSITLFGSHP